MTSTPGETARAATVRRSARAFALPAFVLAVAAVAYAAPARWVASAWSSDPYYSHGFVVALVAIGLLAWRLFRGPAAPRELPAWTLAGVPVAIALYGVGFARASVYLMAWSALALGAAVALATGGPARLKRVGAPLGLLALTIPTPWTLEFGVALQGLATAAAALVLRVVGVHLVADLYTLEAGGVTFTVTPACSGLQSAVSLLAVAALIATVFPMPPARRRSILATAVPLALALNVARIVAIVGVALRWGAAAAEGFFHGASSALLFLAELACLFAIGGLYRRPRAGDERLG